MHHFRSFLAEDWEIIAEFDDPDVLPGPVVFGYKGMIATRRESLGRSREFLEGSAEERV
jgi:hypothetical protein